MCFRSDMKTISSSGKIYPLGKNIPKTLCKISLADSCVCCIVFRLNAMEDNI